MWKAIQIYKYANLLSLDVAFGAICSALFFARLLSVSIRSSALVALGLTVWIIYTTDHLMDAYKVKGTPATTRHQFHQKHQRILKRMIGLAFVIDAFMIFYVKRPVVVAGFVLAVGVALYLCIHRYFYTVKEIVIAILYTLGVLLPSIVVTNLEVQQFPWALIFQFFLTALINLLVFSWFDHDKDLHDGAASFAIKLGKRKTENLIYILLIAVVALSFFQKPMFPVFLILFMNFVLFRILRAEAFFLINDRFRLVGDAIFFVPLLYWIS